VSAASFMVTRTAARSRSVWRPGANVDSPKIFPLAARFDETILTTSSHLVVGVADERMSTAGSGGKTSRRRTSTKDVYIPIAAATAGWQDGIPTPVQTRSGEQVEYSQVTLNRRRNRTKCGRPAEATELILEGTKKKGHGIDRALDRSKRRACKGTATWACWP